MIWGVESYNGMYYTVAVGKRSSVSILRRDAEHAQRTADALNELDSLGSEINEAWDRITQPVRVVYHDEAFFGPVV